MIIIIPIIPIIIIIVISYLYSASNNATSKASYSTTTLKCCEIGIKKVKCFTRKGNKDPRVSSHGTFVNKPDPIFDKPGLVSLLLNRVEAGGLHWIMHERIVREVFIHVIKHVLCSHHTVWDWKGVRN